MTALLGVVFLCLNDKTLKLVGAWFIAEFICYAVTIFFNEYASASEMVSYRYLYATTALFFSAYVIRNKSTYSKSVTSLFILVSILSVASGAYHWLFQSRWTEGGQEFYLDYGFQIDLIYFLSIVALEALMIILGAYSALVTTTNTDNGICGKRR